MRGCTATVRWSDGIRLPDLHFRPSHWTIALRAVAPSHRRDAELRAAEFTKAATASAAGRRAGTAPGRCAGCRLARRRGRRARGGDGRVLAIVRIARNPPRRSSGIGSTRATRERRRAARTGLQQSDLMLADRSQRAGRQPCCAMKGEHRRRSIVRRGVVGRAAEGRGAVAVGDLTSWPASSSVSNSANQPVSTGRSRLSGGTRRKQLPSPSWQYL